MQSVFVRVIPRRIGDLAQWLGRLVLGVIARTGVKTRLNQNGCLEVYLSGGAETMCSLSGEEIQNYFEDCVDWALKTFGESNFVYASVVYHGGVPYVYCVVVPLLDTISRRSRYHCRIHGNIIPQNQKVPVRLSASDLTNRGRLLYYLRSFTGTVGRKYGLGLGKVF